MIYCFTFYSLHSIFLEYVDLILKIKWNEGKNDLLPKLENKNSWICFNFYDFFFFPGGGSSKSLIF